MVGHRTEWPTRDFEKRFAPGRFHLINSVLKQKTLDC